MLNWNGVSNSPSFTAAITFLSLKDRVGHAGVPFLMIASGKQHSVREFVDIAAGRLGITLEWEGTGVNEVGRIASLDKDWAALEKGQLVVRVDPRYFRPSEVETLLGDPTNAKEKLGWTSRTSFSELVKEMVDKEFKEGRVFEGNVVKIGDEFVRKVAIANVLQ